VVNIPVILGLRNLAIAYDMIEYAKMRYNIGSGGEWFRAKADRVNKLDLSQCQRSYADKKTPLLKLTIYWVAKRERLSQQ